MHMIPDQNIDESEKLGNLVAEFLARGGEIQRIERGAGGGMKPMISRAQEARKSGSAKLRTSKSAVKKAPEKKASTGD